MAKKKKNSLGQTDDVEIIEEELQQEEEVKLSSEEALQAELDSLKDQLAIKENNFLKAHADLENTKRRLTNDFVKRSKYMISDFALSLLPAIDNLEKVLSEVDDKDNPLFEAVDMIYRQLKISLKAEGVEEIEAINQKFDPNFHHAVVMEEKPDVDSDMVLEVFQKGYKIKDRVLRASMVKVSQ